MFSQRERSSPRKNLKTNIVSYDKVLAQSNSITEFMQEGQYTSDKIVVPTWHVGTTISRVNV